MSRRSGVAAVIDTKMRFDSTALFGMRLRYEIRGQREIRTRLRNTWVSEEHQRKKRAVAVARLVVVRTLAVGSGGNGKVSRHISQA